ncbi:MAG: hypothetical protein ABIK12_06955, partial [Pseudomonadota bacterium]
MSNTPSQRTVKTPRGEVLLRDRVSPAEMAELEMDQGIGVFSAYRSIITTKDSLTRIAAQPQANLCLALAEDRCIVGYCVMRPSQE